MKSRGCRSERERVFRQAERELRQFEQNLDRITDERRIARLEADLEELERAVEAARRTGTLAGFEARAFTKDLPYPTIPRDPVDGPSIRRATSVN